MISTSPAPHRPSRIKLGSAMLAAVLVVLGAAQISAAAPTAVDPPFQGAKP